MQERHIPNYVDDQPQFFFWEIDEFFPSLVIFIVLYMWGQILLGMMASFVFVKLFGRFKNNHMPGVLFHMVWWTGMMKMNNKFDNGAVREAVK